MKKVTVFIVDDSPLMRKLLTSLLADVPDILVLGMAEDAMDAREQIKLLNPDVLVVDMEMPVMDGVSFLERIMDMRPMPVIMVSTLTQSAAYATIRALELGAVDFISKPTGPQNHISFSQLRESLIEKIRIAGQSNITLEWVYQHVPPAAPPHSQSMRNRIIALGASTGGVEALRDIFSVLPENSPPIVITQYMPALFMPSPATRLNTVSAVEVAEAYDGAKLQTGQAWLAPGDSHLRVVQRGGYLVCQVDDGPLVSGNRPSVDVLFDSVAQAVGAQAVGVLLTGAGRDGALGLLHLRQAGACTITQDRGSSMVYGMPRSAMEIGASEVALPLHEIARYMLRQCEEERAVHYVH